MQSFFYFSKIYDEVINIQYELDYMYEDLLHHYSHYAKSKWNDPRRSEYECIVEYMKDNNDYIIKYIKPKQ